MTGVAETDRADFGGIENMWNPDSDYGFND